MVKEDCLWKKFWCFLHDDSWSSLVVTLIIALVLIKYIFFPALSFVTGTDLPLVIVESCSMYHQESGLGGVFSRADEIYGEYNLSVEDSSDWIFQNGFNKGDVIFVVGPKNIRIGDVIIFNGGQAHPVIHRVISIREEDGETFYTTKGDNNLGLLSVELEIRETQIIGKALFKVPAIGWAKLIFFEGARASSQRGFCS